MPRSFDRNGEHQRRPTPKFSQLGVFRPVTPRGTAQGLFALDADGNNVFDLHAPTIHAIRDRRRYPGGWRLGWNRRSPPRRLPSIQWPLVSGPEQQRPMGRSRIRPGHPFGAPSASCTPTTAAELAACQDIPIAGDWSGTAFRGSVSSAEAGGSSIIRTREIRPAHQGTTYHYGMSWRYSRSC